MLAVVFAVKSADEPFKGFFVGELLFQLCMMLQTLVVIFNQVGCIDRRTDALREFVKSEQAVMELEYLLQSRIFAAESLQKGFQCLPGSLGIVLMYTSFRTAKTSFLSFCRTRRATALARCTQQL